MHSVLPLASQARTGLGCFYNGSHDSRDSRPSAWHLVVRVSMVLVSPICPTSIIPCQILYRASLIPKMRAVGLWTSGIIFQAVRTVEDGRLLRLPGDIVWAKRWLQRCVNRPHLPMRFPVDFRTMLRCRSLYIEMYRTKIVRKKIVQRQ